MRGPTSPLTTVVEQDAKVEVVFECLGWFFLFIFSIACRRDSFRNKSNE